MKNLIYIFILLSLIAFAIAYIQDYIEKSNMFPTFTNQEIEFIQAEENL